MDTAFDVHTFLHSLDSMFATHAKPSAIDEFLTQSMADAENSQDLPGLLTVLNETMGFYRSQSRHEDNQWIIQRALELAIRLGTQNTDAWTSTLVNAATAQRAAKHYDQAQDLYNQALSSAKMSYGENDRRLAALYNNMSMLYSETEHYQQAEQSLRHALAILEHESANPAKDPDIASTYTNLALVLLDEANAENAKESQQTLQKQANQYANRALTIYHTGHLENRAHYASALAGAAQTALALGNASQAVQLYQQALEIIATCYGEHTDYYKTTKSNLEQAQLLERTNAASATWVSEENGMTLCKNFWLSTIRPMIAERYPAYVNRIAAGLVGYGSECFGFDDAISRDHDFSPRVCLWLTDEDYQAIGSALEQDYDKLRNSTGSTIQRTARTFGENKRDGVFTIGNFFTRLTGYATAPSANNPHEWLMLSESTLASATNGKVFADALGDFSKTRQSFKLMPDDVRLSLLSRRLGMMSQAGQYNFPRMIQRHDAAAAWLCLQEFTKATISFIFLLNNPITVGYMPYYKWQFAALRQLSRRPAMMLTDVCAQLEDILHHASEACFSTESSNTNSNATQHIIDTIEHICTEVTDTLNELHLTTSRETFLEWQRPYVEEHIVSTAPCLHSL